MVKCGVVAFLKWCPFTYLYSPSPLSQKCYSQFLSGVTVPKSPQPEESILTEMFRGVVSLESFQGIMSVIPQIEPNLYLTHISKLLFTNNHITGLCAS
jgi:hypothetical protein